MRIPKLFVVAACVSLVVGTLGKLSAQTMSGEEVMNKYYHILKPETAIISMSMAITKNGKTLSRSMTTWGMGDNARGETENKVVKFTAPGDIKGAGFLSAKKVDGSTESRLWLPAMGKVRRLSSNATDQDQAFFGSDFTNRDINGFIESDFTYELNGFSDGIYTIEAKPKKPMGYEKMVYKIDGKDFTCKKIDYYKDGKSVKSQTVAYIVIQNYTMPSSMIMTSASGSTTEIKCTDQNVDKKFSDQIFTERFLKQ
jgi:hypothetical protein